MGFKIISEGKEVEAGSVGEIYSTNEVRIGTWIDGKPVYKRVMSTILAASGDAAFTDEQPITNNGSIDALISLTVVMQRQKNSAYTRYPLPFIYSSDIFASVYVDNNKLYSLVGSKAGSYMGQPIIATLIYTKTTD